MPTDRSLKDGFAEHLADGVLKVTGTSPPVNLNVIAEHLGVSSVEITAMREDGRTSWVDGAPVIELRADRSRERTRFTFAHELAHVMVAKDRKTAVRRTLALEHDEEETLCDWIAAALLMPHGWIRPYVERDVSLSLLRLIASRAEVSLSAAAVRVAEVGKQLCMLLRWKRGQIRWVLVGQAGVPAQLRGHYEISSPANDQLDSMPSRRDLWRDTSLILDGKPISCRAQVDRQGSTCLMLITSISGDNGVSRASVR